MTDAPVAVDDLVAARENLIKAIVGGMPPDHRTFLMSFKRGTPEWPLLGVPAAASLPAVKWRQQNLDKLARKERDELVKRLAGVLGEEKPAMQPIMLSTITSITRRCTSRRGSQGWQRIQRSAS